MVKKNKKLKKAAAATSSNKPADVGSDNSKTKDTKSEIDDLFATVPKQSEILAKKQAQEAAEKKSKKKKKKFLEQKGKGSALDPLAHMGDHRKDRKFLDEDGYRYFIYTEDELKIGQGGGTALCPFDCDCCF